MKYGENNDTYIPDDYELLMDYSLEIIIHFEMDGTIIRYSKAAVEELGFGEQLREVNVADIFRKVLRLNKGRIEYLKGGSDKVIETVAYRKNQTCFPVRFRMIYNRTGAGYGYRGVCIANNVSMGKEALKELEKAKKEIEQSNHSQNEFIANITHELRTPINGIWGLAKGLIETSLTPNQLESVNIIDRCCDNMVKIINNLLDFSKIDAGKLELEEHEFAFRDFINKTMKVNQIAINEKGLRLVVNIAKDIPDRLIGDDLRLSQIINNLISNAVKFTAIGQITMEVIKTYESKDKIELFFMLIDTGIGIGEEERDKLFKSFSQVDTSITRRFGGTGLGLAICKELVELMHGEIKVDSEKGKGSTFSFTIRLRKAVQQAELPDEAYTYDNMSGGLIHDFEKFYDVSNTFKFGTKENLREIEETIEKLIICIELGTWEKAENFAGIVKRLISDDDQELKRKIFRLELSIRKEDYTNSMKQIQELRALIKKVREDV